MVVVLEGGFEAATNSNIAGQTLGMEKPGFATWSDPSLASSLVDGNCVFESVNKKFLIFEIGGFSRKLTLGCVAWSG